MQSEIQLQNHNQLQPVHSNLIKLDVFPLDNFPKLWQEFPDEQIKFIPKFDFDSKLKKKILMISRQQLVP